MGYSRVNLFLQVRVIPVVFWTQFCDASDVIIEKGGRSVELVVVVGEGPSVSVELYILL